MGQGEMVTLSLAGIGFVVWCIRLEGRVNTSEALHKELKEDVVYIRQRIDQALNGK